MESGMHLETLDSCTKTIRRIARVNAYWMVRNLYYRGEAL